MAKMRKEFELFMKLVKFLGDALGPRYEISLYSADDIEKPVICSENKIINENGIDSMGTALLKDILNSTILKEKDYLCSSIESSETKKQNKTSAFYIRDDNGEIIGILCIYEKGIDNVQLRDVVDHILVPNDESNIDSIDMEVETFMKEKIIAVWGKYQNRNNKITKKDKIDAIRELFEIGIFRMKNGAAEISKITGISLASVYRYLNIVIME
ncbi:MAG: PAS domain-containing protein [Intestinibacter sp.]|uniref:PAS domain-containing protein n=1 Tax=Intestinibacter sp. TaxID=1965304 RepID=UPI003F1663BA